MDDSPKIEAYPSTKGFVSLNIGTDKYRMTPSVALKLASDLIQTILDLKSICDLGVYYSLDKEKKTKS